MQGAKRRSRNQIADVTQLIGIIDDKSMKVQQLKYRHFLVNSELEKGRQRVANFAMDTLDPNFLLQKEGFCV